MSSTNGTSTPDPITHLLGIGAPTPDRSHQAKAPSSLLCHLFCSLFLIFQTGSPGGKFEEEMIEVNLHAPSHPFPHYWEHMFGSGRAILSLRDSYRRDLREVKHATGFEYVRFHAIFDDEVGFYDEDAGRKTHLQFLLRGSDL